MKVRILPSFVLAIALLVAQVAAVAAPEAGRYLKAADIDLRLMIPDAPADDSLTTRADLETIVNVQERRTPEEAMAAALFDQQDIFQNADVIGPWFTAKHLPQTAAFFAQIAADRFAISSKGKVYWHRPRPPLIDARVKPAIELPTTGAYPSGHTTQAFVNAALLAELFPDLRDPLREHARRVAWSRVIAGVHYPSDTAAGQMLGERLASLFLQRPEVREALARLRAEIEPVRDAVEKSVADERLSFVTVVPVMAGPSRRRPGLTRTSWPRPSPGRRTFPDGPAATSARQVAEAKAFGEPVAPLTTGCAFIARTNSADDCRGSDRSSRRPRPGRS